MGRGVIDNEYRKTDYFLNTVVYELHNLLFEVPAWKPPRRIVDFTNWVDVIASLQCKLAPLLDGRIAVVLFPVFNLPSFRL